MRTLFDVLEDCSNATQVAVLKAVVSSSCIRSFYACLAKVKRQDKQQESQEALTALKLLQTIEPQSVEMSQVWKSLEVKARDALMPKCQTPYDAPQSSADLFKFILESKPKPAPADFLKALAGEIGVSVEDLTQFNEISQRIKQDELLTYSKDVLQEYLGIDPDPQDVEFDLIPLKVWLILGEKALQAIEKEKERVTKRALVRQSITDLASIRLLNSDIPLIQQWVKEVHQSSPYEACEFSEGLELPQVKTLKELLESYKK